MGENSKTAQIQVPAPDDQASSAYASGRFLQVAPWRISTKKPHSRYGCVFGMGRDLNIAHVCFELTVFFRTCLTSISVYHSCSAVPGDFITRKRRSVVEEMIRSNMGKLNMPFIAQATFKFPVLYM